MAQAQITIEARVQQALDGIEQLNRKLDFMSNKVDTASRAMDGMKASTDLAARAMQVLLGAISVQTIVNLADAATNVNNKLKTLAENGINAGQAFQEVGKIANTTGQRFEAVGDLYQKIGLQAKNLGLSQQEVTRITENFSKALAITGTTGSAAASAIYQFGQAIGRGKVAYEDIRQLQESSAGTVALIGKQFGMTANEFVLAVQKQKISGEQLALAMNAMGGDINGTFNNMNKSIGQSLENIRTNFILMLDRFEQRTGVFAKIAKLLELVANNIDTVVVAGTVFFTVFAAKKILDIAAAFTTLNTVIKRNPLLFAASVGAAGAGFIYDKFFGDKKPEDIQKDLEKTESAVRGVTDVRKKTEAEITKEQAAGLENYLRGLDAAAKTAGLRGIELEIAKAITGAAKELGIEEKDLSKTLRSRIAAKTTERVLNENLIKTQTQLIQQGDQLSALAIQDVNERRVATKLAQYKQSVDEKTYKANAGNVAFMERAIIAQEQQNRLSQIYLTTANAIEAAAIEDNSERRIAVALQQARVNLGRALTEQEELNITTLERQRNVTENLTNLKRQAAESQINLNVLSIQDLDKRQEQLAVDKERLRVGKDFTAEMEAQIRASVRSNQQAQEALALEKQRALLEGRGMPQSRAQQIETATGAIGRLDPRLAAESQYDSEMKALKDTEFKNEIDRQQMMERLKREHHERLHQIAKRQAEADLRSAGVTNQGILDAVSKSQDNIRLMKEGGIKAVMGGIDQMGYIFSQLGTYNKRAFDAAKAFNIANAVMNTYLGATKALAMYPPPFNFIAAAAVVASGLAQVAAIRSQSFSGRQLGGPVMGGQSYIVGENGPELFTPNTTGSITRNQDLGSGRPVTVNFQIVANDTTGFDQLLYSRRGMITQIINDAVLEKGKRSIA